MSPWALGKGWDFSLHGACPERGEILRSAQNDSKRRVQGQNDNKELPNIGTSGT